MLYPKKKFSEDKSEADLKSRTDEFN